VTETGHHRVDVALSLAILALLSCGCDSKGIPSSPSPVNPPVQMAGRVVDAESGASLAGVVLVFRNCGIGGACSTVSTSTDAAGAFDVSLKSPSGAFTQVALNEQGYESSEMSVPHSGGTGLVLKMFRTITLRPGDSVPLEVFDGSSPCGFESALCRRLIVDSSGQPVDVEVIPEAGDAALLASIPFSFPPTLPHRLTTTGGDLWLLPLNATFKGDIPNRTWEQRMTVKVHPH